ncbi:tail fiber protein [Vibrio phage K165]
MAIRKDNDYPGRWLAASPDYPMGNPKNRTTSISKDGSYLEKKWIQDYEAFFGAMMNYAAITPSGTVDTAGSSQFFDALQSCILKTRVGQTAQIHSAQIPNWLLKADGSTVSRVVDDVLWDHASNSGLVISQATKDANPEQYAMYYGDGDGSATFSLPNWYLGHFARGNPSGVSLGETQEDAIRNIVGSLSDISGGINCNGLGAFAVEYIGTKSAGTNDIAGQYNATYDASRVTPTASENRPKSGHINVCIERGKSPA